MNTYIQQPLIFDSMPVARVMLQQLENMHGDHFFTTLYLNVDGKTFVQPHDYLRQMDALKREAEAWSVQHPTEAGAIHDDIAWIEQQLSGDLDRSHTRGLLFVVSTPNETHTMMELPFPIRTAIAFLHEVATEQLHDILADSRTVRAILMDSSHAKIFRLEFDRLELERKQTVDDKLLNLTTERTTQEHLQRHKLELTRQHLRRVRKTLQTLLRSKPTDYVLLGGTEETIGLFEKELTEQMRSLIGAHINVRVTSRVEEIHVAIDDARAELFRQEMERRLELALSQPQPEV